jgi:DNA-binding CsgD family transcriptional regulator
MPSAIPIQVDNSAAPTADSEGTSRQQVKPGAGRVAGGVVVRAGLVARVEGAPRVMVVSAPPANSPAPRGRAFPCSFPPQPGRSAPPRESRPAGPAGRRIPAWNQCRVHGRLLRDSSDDFAMALESGGIRDCLLAVSVSAWLGGEVSRGIELAARAAEPAVGGCGGDCSRLAKIWHARLLARVRDVAAATRVLESAGGSAGTGAADAVSVALLVCRAELALARGDVGGAVAGAGSGVRLAGEASVPVLLPSLRIVLAVGAVRQSDMTTGLQHARLLGEDALLGRTAYARGQSAWAAAQAMEAGQGLDGIADLVERLITSDRLNRDLFSAQPAAAAWLVRCARAMGEEGLAAKCVQRAEVLSREARGFRAIQAAALHAGALFENSPGELRAASALHLDRWASASASEDLARVWSAQPAERGRAVAVLKHAAAAYEEAGAARDLARVARRLRDLGVHAGRVTRAVRRNGGTAVSLTDTEFAVAELVSQGLTNAQAGRRLYISANTVAFHLKNIFRKLRFSSRAELASAWADLTSG